MFWLPLAMAAAGGISNMVSGNAQAEQQRRNIRMATEELSKNLITKEELDRYLEANKLSFGRQLSSLMNTTAMRTGGLANANVVKAAAAAPIVAAEAQSELGIRTNVRQQNASTRGQIAQLQMGMPASDPLGDFVSGATAGAGLGMEMNKFGAVMDKLNAPPTDYAGDAAAFREANNIPVHNPDIPGNTLSFGAENLGTGMNMSPNNRYIDFLGDDQLYAKQNRWRGFDFNLFK